LSARNPTNNNTSILILGIGNVLMGDEGVGVHIVRRLEAGPLPENVCCLDGGTGSFLLLEPMQQAGRVILVDATIDKNSPGTLRRLTPQFSTDYPVTLTAHDIGLKDLLDAAYLMGGKLDVALYAISIAPLQGVGMELSPAIAQRVDEIANVIRADLANLCQSLEEDARSIATGEVDVWAL
jgi:hydrogenase maturation protease